MKLDLRLGIKDFRWENWIKWKLSWDQNLFAPARRTSLGLRVLWGTQPTVMADLVSWSDYYVMIFCGIELINLDWQKNSCRKWSRGSFLLFVLFNAQRIHEPNYKISISRVLHFHPMTRDCNLLIWCNTTIRVKNYFVEVSNFQLSSQIFIFMFILFLRVDTVSTLRIISSWSSYSFVPRNFQSWKTIM